MLGALLFSLSIFIFIIIAAYFLIKSRVKECLKTYESKISKCRNIKNKPLMVIGPSGSGKDTLMNKLITKYPKKFTKCISYTTRLPRENEKEAINYHFISKQKFNELDQKGEIIGKFEKYDNMYGTSKKEIIQTLSTDRIVYFDYNIETAIKTFKEGKLEFNYIAILPPNIEILAKRLRDRATEDENSFKKRMDYAKNEIELIKNSEFINYIVINDVLEKSSIEFESNVKQLYPNFFI